MATAHQIRELIIETTAGSVRPRIPCDVRDEIFRYASAGVMETRCITR
ncbi:MAG: hypothetical protein JRG84_13170 [Deltaproteobacteria bacterium]|nr:hypothetical protein [Deltaproteobacteria bacterium]